MIEMIGENHQLNIGKKHMVFLRVLINTLLNINLITTVVHCKKQKYDIYIGRPGKWGNPFIIGKEGVVQCLN